MQSTGHASTHAVSLVLMQGSAITYVIKLWVSWNLCRYFTTTATPRTAHSSKKRRLRYRLIGPRRSPSEMGPSGANGDDRGPSRVSRKVKRPAASAVGR